MAGVYVHVPFCHSKCAYCDFYSIANTKRLSDYAEALAREWCARRCELGGEDIRTIYFGGGTPSLLPAETLMAISSLLPREHVREFTIEVNPEDVNPTAVARWMECGVNRVSMGVQSLVDDELRAVGRRHSASDAVAAVNCLRSGGISNISCDLIYGLPGQTISSWDYSVSRLLDLGIDHLSAYNLSFEPGTRLYLQLQRGLVKEADEETVEEMYRLLCRRASSSGMAHYEISNFAMPGRESAHNSSYWTGVPYLGLGPGAHSLSSDGVRRYVPSDLKAYLSEPETAAIIDEESAIDRINDRILIGLRTAAGLPLEVVAAYRDEILTKAEQFIRRGLLVRDEESLFIPEEHWLVSDSIIRELFVE